MTPAVAPRGRIGRASAGPPCAGRGHGAGSRRLHPPLLRPGVSLSFGVDRDRTLNRQLDWTGQVWNDGVPHAGRVYDQHSGVDYPMALRSEVAAAKDGTVIDVEGSFGTSQFGNFGNFVLLQHADGRRTLYYHLASAADGGIGVAIGDAVVAGQLIGRSGCSGTCYGAHLHFEMLVWNATAKAYQPADPLAERRWTTWPGRIPFAAAYVRESNSGTEVISQGQTITHWVEFRNTGGRTWRNNATLGRIGLGTWSPAAHASLFTASGLALQLDGDLPRRRLGRAGRGGALHLWAAGIAGGGQLPGDLQPAGPIGPLVRPCPPGRVLRADPGLEPAIVRAGRIRRDARHGRRSPSVDGSPGPGLLRIAGDAPLVRRTARRAGGPDLGLQPSREGRRRIAASVAAARRLGSRSAFRCRAASRCCPAPRRSRCRTTIPG